MLCLKPYVYSTAATPTYCVRMFCLLEFKCEMQLENAHATQFASDMHMTHSSSGTVKKAAIFCLDDCFLCQKLCHRFHVRKYHVLTGCKMNFFFAAQSHRAVFLPLTDCHIRITVSSLHTRNHKSFQRTQFSPIGRNDNNYKHQDKKSDPSPTKFNIFKSTFKHSETHKGVLRVFDRASSS